MTTETTQPAATPTATKSMNTKALNSLADVICRAQENGKRTPMGIACAIDSAQRHMSPETAAELEQLRAEVAALRAERHSTNESLSEAAEQLRVDRDRIAELEALAAAATEYRVWEPGYGLYVRRSPGVEGFAILEARRTAQGRRAWTRAGLRYVVALSDAELYCWPNAESAVAEARRVLPGAVVREEAPVDARESARCLTPHAFSPRSGGWTVCLECDHGKDAGCHQGGAE